MLTYLALGDSYTIGEQVIAGENFPHQAVDMLRHEYNIEVAAPKIIAVTGWTTDELNAAIAAEKPEGPFTFVSLLIGVNNQYRGRDLENYEGEFTDLLQQAIAFAGGRPDRVFVLSVPDWGVTPFAEGKDRTLIATQIDGFNAVNRKIAASYNCPYIDVTGSSRSNGSDESFLTPDKLHYAAKEYSIWAQLLADAIACNIAETTA